MPRLELVNLEAQLKAAEAALAAAEAERDRGVVRAPWAGVVTDVAVEVGRRRSPSRASEIAPIVALDPMLAVVEVAERKLAGIKVGEPAEVRLVTGETAQRPSPLRVEVGERDHAHLSGRDRDRQCRRRDSRRHHRRGVDSAGAGRRRRACRARR